MFSTLKQLWQILAPQDRRKAILVLLLVIIMAAFETAGVVSIVPFLVVITQPETIQTNDALARLYDALGFSDRQNFIIALGLASAAIIAFSSVFKTITQHILNRFSHLQLHSISTRLLRNYLHQPYTFFLQRNTSDLSKNLLSETDQAVINLIQPVVQSIAQAVVILAMALLLLIYDPWVAVSVTVVVGLLYASIYLLVRKRLTHIGIDRIRANQERYQSSNEALAGIKDVKLTGAIDAYLSRFSQATRRFARHRAASDTMAQTPLYLVEAVGYCGLILIAIVLIHRSGDATQALPALGLYGFASYRMLPGVQILYRGLSRIRFSAPALTHLYTDLCLQPVQPAKLGSLMLAPGKEIRLDNLTFYYPGCEDTPVLKNFNLTIPAKTTIAIIGRSGAGKSTLMDILLGLLQPQRGHLLIDGAIISFENAPAWQRAIGYVPQHIYLADVSVAENIAFGIAPKLIDQAAVERAAKVAQLHDFVVNELKEGYQTLVGDRGIRLSGGQRQRLGIARALYRNPPVLFLDEATSALDVNTEAGLLLALRTLANDKTVIVITHRKIDKSAVDYVVSLDKTLKHTSPVIQKP